MRWHLALLILLATTLFQCRPTGVSGSSTSGFYEFEIDELADFDYKFSQKVSGYFEGQRYCLATVKKAGGPDFLLFTSERLISWAGFSEKGCLQERYLKDIPERMKLELWRGPVREMEVQGASIPWGAKAFDVTTDLLGEVNGVKVPVGFVIQHKVVKDGRVFQKSAPKLSTLCQFGEVRVNVFNRNCKLQVSHPYKYPEAKKSLQLVLPH